MEVAENRGSSLWKALFFPVFVPIFALKLLGKLRERRMRECLPGKVVVITGASSGLGEQLAHVFYLAGCRLILCSRRADELERVRKDLLESPVQGSVVYPPTVIPLNVSDLESMPQKAAQILDIHGYVDILVNNAGISVRGPILDCVDDVSIQLMMVNYFGLVKLTQLLVPSMVARQEGRVVAIGSVQGKFAIPFRAAYAASKHALQAFCDSLRAEVAEHNVKVTLISPGYVQTNVSLNALAPDGSVHGKMDKETAAGDPADVMARKILGAILRDEKDVVFAGLKPRLAIWLRFLCPSLYFYIMEKRAKKGDGAPKRE